MSNTKRKIYNLNVIISSSSSSTHSLTPYEVYDSAHDHSDISRDHSEIKHLSWCLLIPFSLLFLTSLILPLNLRKYSIIGSALKKSDILAEMDHS